MCACELFSWGGVSGGARERDFSFKMRIFRVLEYRIVSRILKTYLVHISLCDILNGEGHSRPTRIRQGTMGGDEEDPKDYLTRQAAAGEARWATLKTTLR